MAKIRGIRNPWPTAGLKPTGILSTRGKQKLDPGNDAKDEALRKYAVSAKGRKK